MRCPEGSMRGCFRLPLEARLRPRRGLTYALFRLFRPKAESVPEGHDAPWFYPLGLPKLHQPHARENRPRSGLSPWVTLAGASTPAANQGAVRPLPTPAGYRRRTRKAEGLADDIGPRRANFAQPKGRADPEA